ncbi:MAG: formylglycine-generating enzyme family protein [Fibromonadaceae bacterium]|jgi:formylglycine-generating enzyme required for sulfatase activity|nr:formylglycine-generating enzyme family protein [Fibromonadaceae bacterium]
MSAAKFLVTPAFFAIFLACGEVDGGFEDKSGSSSSQNCQGKNCPSSSSRANSSSSFYIELDWMLENLVTQSQYKAVMGINPSKGIRNDTLPIEGVSWFDAVEFCKKLSILMGLDSNAIKLPTETEWENAASSGIIQRNIEYWEWTNDCLGLQPICPEGDYKILKGFNKKIDERRGESPYSENVGGYISFRVVRK